jgi:hypothetical protein
MSNVLLHSLEQTMGRQSPGHHIPKPSVLCHWSIHVQDVIYDEDDIPEWELPDKVDLDEEGLAKWPQHWKQQSIQEVLRDNLESNDFSCFKENDLPVAIPTVAKATKRSPNELIEESFVFAIIARNEELVRDIFQKIKNSKRDISSLHPLHLATSYLDGAKTCCNILSLLCVMQNNVKDVYINHLGHTVLDNLMITILKAHTSISPKIVDVSLEKGISFAGQEVDLCGRWDADFPCFRSLLERGGSSVPFEWKHAFCHTSIQAICHCIDTLANFFSLNVPSGLFLKYCSHCGMKLQLLPLHTLVLTAFHLANSGCEGEDLFGIIACLLCLLCHGVKSRVTAPLSIMALLGTNESDHCDHKQLTPAQLVEELSANVGSVWSTSAKLGWEIFCRILRISEDESVEQHDDDDDDDDIMDLDSNFEPCEETCHDVGFPFGNSVQLGHIWAAMQTELLTYRRLRDGDPWHSENLNVTTLLEDLKSGSNISIGLVQKSMMRPYCKCGRFGDRSHFVLREEAAEEYFSNLDDFKRTSFINVPSHIHEFYY